MSLSSDISTESIDDSTDDFRLCVEKDTISNLNPTGYGTQRN